VNRNTGCQCPYCDGPASTDDSVCTPCRVEVRTCPSCGRPLPKDAPACTECDGQSGPNQKENQPCR